MVTRTSCVHSLPHMRKEPKTWVSSDNTPRIKPINLPRYFSRFIGFLLYLQRSYFLACWAHPICTPRSCTSSPRAAENVLLSAAHFVEMVSPQGKSFPNSRTEGPFSKMRFTTAGRSHTPNYNQYYSFLAHENSHTMKNYCLYCVTYCVSITHCKWTFYTHSHNGTIHRALGIPSPRRGVRVRIHTSFTTYFNLMLHRVLSLLCELRPKWLK